MLHLGHSLFHSLEALLQIMFLGRHTVIPYNVPQVIYDLHKTHPKHQSH